MMMMMVGACEVAVKETLSLRLSLREENKMQMFASKVLKNVFS
jgi:hypothetical protein